MSGEAVFIAVSIAIIFAFTAYEIWVLRRRLRLHRELKRLLDEAAGKDD